MIFKSILADITLKLQVDSCGRWNVSLLTTCIIYIMIHNRILPLKSQLKEELSCHVVVI